MSRACCYVLLLTLAAAAVAAPAAAQPSSLTTKLGRPTDEVALEHLKRGNDLYEVSDFEAAIAEWKAGYLVENAGVFLYNIAQAYRIVGNYDKAIWHYEQFLRLRKPTGDVRERVEELIEEMKQAKATATSPPSGPAPLVDDKAGPQLTAGHPATESGEAPRNVHVDGPAQDAESDRWYRDWLGWTAAGAGAAGLLTGGLLLVSANNLDDDANLQEFEEDRRALHDRADRRRTWGYVAFGLGAAGLAVGVVKLIIHGDAGHSASGNVSIPGRRSWDLVLDPNMLGLRGTF